LHDFIGDHDKTLCFPLSVSGAYLQPARGADSTNLESQRRQSKPSMKRGARGFQNSEVIDDNLGRSATDMFCLLSKRDC
jgi:hypothetical protein